ncbi:MAG: M1 family metallopeptidase [Balneolaceae bacterium]
MRNLRLLTISTVRFALIFLLAVSCSSVRQTGSQMEETSSIQPERPIPYPLEIPAGYLNAVETGTRTAEGEPGPSYWQNEASYQLKAELIPSEYRVNGSASIEFTNFSSDGLPFLLVELSQNLHKAGTMKKENTEITGGIELLRISLNNTELEEQPDGQPLRQGEPSYLIDATRMILVLDETLQTGETADLEIEWTFVVPQQGASGRMGHSRDNLFYIAYWYPKVSVYDDANGWFDDPFLGNAEFYHGFADYEFEVTLPDNWLVMGSGEFLNPDDVLADHVLERYREAGNSDEVLPIVTEADFGGATQFSEDGLHTWKFSAERVRDVAFSATRESVWDGARTPAGDLDGDGQEEYTRINSFYRTTAPLWTEQAAYSQHSITFLSEYLDLPYPWPHMTSVEGEEIIGGGMEFPMMTIIGSYNGQNPQRLHSVTAHEFAHMWIPMILSTNERRYSWMDEGFTTFNTHQAMADAYPDDYENLDMFANYLQIAGTDYEGPMIRWSDYHYPGPAFGVASYPKPASVLQALQGILGEELFLEAYHSFIDRWTYKHPYPWDFFQTVEDVTGLELDWFWRSWYYETWTLNHSIEHVSRDGSETTIEIRDNGFVPMPVHLTIRFENGSEREEIIPVDEWLMGKKSVTFRIESKETVESVTIDRENNFPYVDRSNLNWNR